MPELKLDVPDFKAPDVKIPDFKAPEFKAPDVSIPKVSTPKFDIPAAPKVSAPSFSTPDLPKVPSFSAPSFGGGSSTSAPSFEDIEPQEVRDERAAAAKASYKEADSAAKVRCLDAFVCVMLIGDTYSKIISQLVLSFFFVFCFCSAGIRG